MSTREQLNLYLRGLESRLRLLVLSRGVAVALGVALGATVALVLITNAFAFSATSMAVARVTLYISLAVAIALGLVIPLLKLNQRRAASKAERAHPDFEQRLITYIDRRDAQDPMLELLAEDTLLRAPQAPPARVIPPKSIFAFGTSAGAALAVLMWLILAEGGFLHFGARTLWAGLPKGDQPGFYQIVVEPGDVTIRRRTDQPIVATLRGFNAPEVRLMVKYQSSAKWEQTMMMPRPGESSYGFLIAAVPEELQYYVEAAGVKSKAYTINVVDLPGIKNIKVTYHFPSWLGQKELVEDPGGDLRAVVGTVAELTVETDRPLTNGVVQLQDGREIEMTPLGGNLLRVRVPVDKDGVYHFAAKNGDELIRLSQDYFIEAQADEGPKVSIRRPGPDARVNPIEEVLIQVQADDDYGLTALDLHYSVNGQPEKVVHLLGNQRGRLAAEGEFLLYLEDFHLAPGDVVSLYATARDARTESASDINFIEAVPFEKNYSQAQSAGGGGGGGGGGQQEENEISRRQREIITLTHRALRGNPEEKSAATKERAEFLAEVQSKLRDQATSLANRVKARQLDGESSTIGEFVKEIEAAAAEMGPAAEALSGAKWAAALIPEQKALQHLQRAEQMNRDIQVAFGNQGGGGGGGGGNAGRDLANLFDLELDTEKNQYEQAQQAQGGGSEQQQQIDEALRKLQELARRQEQLAQQSRNNKQISVDRRWEQEQLRREVEQLRRQLEQMQAQQQGQQGQQRAQAQLSRNGSQGGQQGQQGQQQGQGQQQRSQGKQGQQARLSAEQQRIQQLLDRLNQAQEDMREAQRASQKGDQSQADAAARRAAERLQEAQQAGSQLQRQNLRAGLESLEQRAQALAERQAQMENRLKQAYPRGSALTGKQAGPGLSQQERQEMAAEKDQMRQQLAQLERDAQRQARDLSNQQPEASRRLREGLSEVQQAEAQRRLEYGAEYIRRGTPSQIADWTSRERPLTESLQALAESIRDARGALREGDQRNAAQSDLERQVANLERTRAQLERALAQQQARQGQQEQNGKQGGQQQGQQGQQGQQAQQGQQGQQGQGGQQGGNQQGGNQFGGDRIGGYTNGGYYGGPYGGYDRFGRYNPEGLYDPRNAVPIDPRQVLRDAQRDLQALRSAVRDNRDLAAQAAALERQLQDLTFGNPSGPELQERLSRTVLPQLETLEVALRQELEKTEGQVRSASADRTPAGFAEAVSEYFRRLSRSK